MSVLKEKAFEIAYALYNQDVLKSSEYEAIRDGLDEIEALRVRDEELEKLWTQLGDIPIDPDTECITEQFLEWGPGIKREKILQWFDERHSKGVAYLMYRDGVDRTVEIARLCYLKQLCPECDSDGCIFNPDGLCKFPFVGGRAPIQNDDGCIDIIRKRTDKFLVE